jgi:serralysin
VADGGTGKDTLVAELSDSSAAPFIGSGADLRFINTLDLEHPDNNTGTFHGGTFENFETIQADSSGSFYVFDFHGSDKNENILASTSEDTVDGRGGDDIIFGGYDSDRLTGGAGADRFWFRYATDSDVTNGQDTITDFKHGEHDRIDLSKIYGPKLDFIGSKNFDGHAGEVHAIKKGGDTLVEADTNGDKHADFSLLLDGGPKLVENDFVL